MTVKILITNLDRLDMNNRLFYGIVKCSWFENNTLKEQEFHQDMLQFVIKD